MPLTAAERQKRYKEKLKLNPEKYEEYKRKKRENYHSKKRLVSDLTPKEKYNARVVWRLRKKNLRQNKKNLNRLIDMTPPSSPSVLLPEENLVQNLPQQDANIQDMDEPIIDADVVAPENKTKKRRKIRRDRSKLYRENLRLQEENQKLRKQYEKYRKRCQRNKKDTKETIKSDDSDGSTKYRKLSNAIKDRYQNTKKHKEKKLFKNIFENIYGSIKKEIVTESLGVTSKIKTTFYTAVKDVSKINLFLISSSDIEKISKNMPSKIRPLVGTKNVHQIFTTVPGELFRHLSCFCKTGFCECLFPKAYTSILSDVNSEIIKSKPISSYDEDLSVKDKESWRSPLKELIQLSQAPIKNFYKLVYKTPETSDDENCSPIEARPGTFREDCKENRKVKQGDFLLVNVHSHKGKIFKYVCVVNDLHEDGELRVTFLRSVRNKKTFRIDDKDIADIDYTDIIEVLSDPIKNTKRGQNYYVFDFDVQVIEK